MINLEISEAAASTHLIMKCCRLGGAEVEACEWGGEAGCHVSAMIVTRL
jgi:hypothetical protein